MKDIVTPVAPDEVRRVIKKCLENAALANYTKICETAKIEGTMQGQYYGELLYIFSLIYDGTYDVSDGP